MLPSRRRGRLLALLLVAGCDAPQAKPRSAMPGAGPSAAAPAIPSAAPATVIAAQRLVLHVPGGPFGATPVVVLVPARERPTDRFPVLVAFHGRGEALKEPTRGARGWVDDYTLDRTLSRLVAPPLTRQDLLGFVTDARLRLLNDGLARTPYRGLVVACPYLPDVLRGEAAFRQAAPLADFIADHLLPRLREETPSTSDAAVDGVSLGGRAALLVGLSRPDAFASVGALQPAIDRTEIPRLVALALTARRRNPNQSLRLLTSDEDYFLRPTKALAAALDRAHVDATLDVVTGPHSYEFNRGPGGYEMLLHHDRALGR